MPFKSHNKLISIISLPPLIVQKTLQKEKQNLGEVHIGARNRTGVYIYNVFVKEELTFFKKTWGKDIQDRSVLNPHCCRVPRMTLYFLPLCLKSSFALVSTQGPVSQWSANSVIDLLPASRKRYETAILISSNKFHLNIPHPYFLHVHFRNILFGCLGGKKAQKNKRNFLIKN